MKYQALKMGYSNQFVWGAREFGENIGHHEEGRALAWGKLHDDIELARKDLADNSCNCGPDEKSPTKFTRVCFEIVVTCDPSIPTVFKGFAKETQALTYLWSMGIGRYGRYPKSWTQSISN